MHQFMLQLETEEIVRALQQSKFSVAVFSFQFSITTMKCDIIKDLFAVDYGTVSE